jgi:hypothetical protein
LVEGGAIAEAPRVHDPQGAYADVVLQQIGAIGECCRLFPLQRGVLVRGDVIAFEHLQEDIRRLRSRMQIRLCIHVSRTTPRILVRIDEWHGHPDVEGEPAVAGPHFGKLVFRLGAARLSFEDEKA